MKQYYFTVASLPALVYTHKPPLSSEAFLEICRSTLGAGDYRILENIHLAHPEKAVGTNGILGEWQCWELNLRNTLVKLRAKAKGLSPAPFLKSSGENFDAQRTAQSVFDETSPLKAEESLDRARWLFLEENEVRYHFDLSRLILYYLKLQILERKYSFNPQEGEKKYKDIMQSFHERINTRENTYGK